MPIPFYNLRKLLDLIGLEAENMNDSTVIPSTMTKGHCAA
jgi:hypothetical protein